MNIIHPDGLYLGGPDDDSYSGTDVNDQMYGGGGNDTLTGNGGDDHLEGGDGEDSLLGGFGNDWLDGGDNLLLHGDTLSGWDGDDTYVIGTLLDQITGENSYVNQYGASVSRGNDTVRSSISYTLGDYLENLVLTDSAASATGNAAANILTGTDGANTLEGVEGNDTLYGNGGDDRMDGGAGDDYMEGGAGNDIYLVGSSSDTVAEADAAGEDRVEASASFTLGANIEILVLQGPADQDGAGNATANTLEGNIYANLLSGGDGDDTLYGYAGADVLDGGAGADSLVGGGDNDVYRVDSDGDVVVESQDSGEDRIEASISCTLPDSVENLTLLGSEPINGTGNNEANRLEGNSATNVLDGGVGVDQLVGGGGYDIYWVDQSADTVIELTGGGIDTVHATTDYTLPPAVERLILEGSDNSDATGNSLPNRLVGQSGNNQLDGQQGNDSLVGGDGNDQLFGREGDDTLDGGVGNDTLDGGPGRDSMIGGAGDDVFYVDYNDGVGTVDIVVEALSGAAGGHDRILSTVSYTLPANVEVLRLKGTDNIEAIGNALPNRIDGNPGDNHIVGGGGDDSMWGGPGVDSMEGGAGDDTYYVDDIADVTDEGPAVALLAGHEPQAGGGNADLVISLVTFTLRANLENLLLDGSKDLDGTGNELNNILTGNPGNNALTGRAGADTLGGGAGNDVLDGGAGNDTLIGGPGNDTYIVDAAGDVILPETSAQDLDTVKASVGWTLNANIEKLVLAGTALNGTGNAQANTLSGNGSDNLLKGLSNDDVLLGFVGADVLSGGAGKDTLTGGAGADKFLFDAAPSVPNADTITDFLSGTDTIRLDDDFFTQFDAASSTTLLAGQFFKSAASGAAHDANDRIIYNASTGALFYDPDGTGAEAAVRFATLSGAPVLTAADFVIVG